MMARRRWPRPIAPSVKKPSPSGPRCFTASVIRRSSAVAAGWPSRLRMPAMPHIAGVLSRLGAARGDLGLVAVAPGDQPLQPVLQLDLGGEADLLLGPLR